MMRNNCFEICPLDKKEINNLSQLKFIFPLKAFLEIIIIEMIVFTSFQIIFAIESKNFFGLIFKIHSDKLVTIAIGFGAFIIFRVFKIINGIRKLQKRANEFSNQICTLYETGYPTIVKKGILPKMWRNYKSCENNDRMKERQSKVDNLICPPLTYCYNLVDDQIPPKFNPQDRFIDELFSPNTNNVIAVTGADPSMWIDPLLFFYLINTGLLSLMKDLNSEMKPNKKVSVCQNRDNKIDVDFKNIKNDLVLKLSSNNLLKEFFIARFFLLSSDVINKYKDAFLPSLYAIHELFRIRAFFINENEMLAELHNNKCLEDYLSSVKNIWRLLGVNRENVASPEFLIINRANNSEVFTYDEGEVKNKIIHSTSNDYENIQKLIKHIATICSIERMLFTPDIINSHYCFYCIN